MLTMRNGAWSARLPSGLLLTERRGSTLIEVLATLAVITILAAALVPSVAGIRDASRVAEAARVLEDLAVAIADHDTNGGSFHLHVKRYPAKLEHLTRPIVAGDENSCSRGYTTGDIFPPKWQGPYFNRVITASGIPLGIGILQNDLVRDDPFTVQASRLKIQVSEVTIDDARALDTRFDLGDGQASGTIQWGGAELDGLITLSYAIVVYGC